MTRWREDVTTRCLGQLLLRPRSRQRRALVDHAISRRRASRTNYEVIFAPDRAVFRRRRRRDRDPHRDRRLSGGRCGAAARVGDQSRIAPRELDLTSYAEVVLAPGDADLAHPAFSNLFVETRIVPERDALHLRAPPALRHRPPVSGPRAERPRARGGRRAVRNRPGAVHRPRPHARPSGCALATGAPLSQHHRSGARSDRQPAHAVRLPPGAHRAADLHDRLRRQRRGARVGSIEKYHDRRAVARALALASTHSQIELRHLGLTIEDTIAVPAPRRPADLRRPAAARGRSDRAEPPRPARSLEVRHLRRSADPPAARDRRRRACRSSRELLKAHEYLRRKGLAVRSRHPQRTRRRATCRICSTAAADRREQSRATAGSTGRAASSCGAPT